MTTGGRHGFIANPTAPSAMSGIFLTLAPSVIYGQEVLYAARGQDARSRPAAGRNPVIETLHSRASGNDNHRQATQSVTRETR